MRNLLNLNIIKLKLIPTIGNRTILNILYQSDILTKENITLKKIKNFLSELQTVEYKKLESQLDNEVERIFNVIEHENIQVININDSEYPEPLRKIFEPPTILFYKGNLEYNFHRSIAVVGTRKFSEYGKLACEKFVKVLGQKNFTIVSGLAIGIDTIAHKTAVENKAKCIGVIGSGIDIVYPAQNRYLFEQILKNNGCIISEFLPGTPALPENFPIRNRIVAGLAKGTLVVEAAKKSGSLITANLAFGENRDVYAIPRDIDSISSQGCNEIIKSNIARLVTAPEDLFKDYEIPEESKSTPLGFEVKEEIKDPNYKKVINALSMEKFTIDELSFKLDLDITDLASILSEMEIEGYIMRNEEGKWLTINY